MSSQSGRILLVAAALLISVHAAFPVDTPPPGTTEAPSRAIAVAEDEVADVFFAYIVGVLLGDAALDIDGAALSSMFPEFAEGGAQVPFEQIDRITRTRTPGAEVILRLHSPLDYPVPVDIIGYHPGTVLSSLELVFSEEAYAPSVPGFGTVRLEWLESGYLRIDFVGWLDFLLGNWIDDVDARVLAIAEYEDHWYAIMAGDTPDGGWITGVYDLQSSRIVVRPPRPLRELGRALEELSRSRR